MQLSKVFAKYIDSRNKKIINLRKKGTPVKSIARKFKLSERHIRRVLSGRT